MPLLTKKIPGRFAQPGMKDRQSVELFHKINLYYLRVGNIKPTVNKIPLLL
jgi:hypothetical protein